MDGMTTFKQRTPLLLLFTIFSCCSSFSSNHRPWRLLLGLKNLYKQHQQECPDLIQAMESLVTARTIQQVTQAGKSLTLLDLTNQHWYTTYSTELHTQVLERVVKATALTGLFYISLNITSHLLHQQNLLPSQMCQDAICQGLRKGGKLKQLEQLLLQLGKVATRNNTSIVAYNIFLAALCDPITDKTTDKSFWAPVNPTEKLLQAAAWLDANKTTTLLGIQPDSVSYSTVLNAAAQCGNATLANEIWNTALTQTNAKNFQIQLYNARLKSLSSRPENDLAMLLLWQQLKLQTTPDRYTIDLMILPLLRAGRIGEMEVMLDHFVLSSQAEELVADAFQAFLWTMVDKGSDVAAAKAIFDLYIAPALAPVLRHDQATSLRLVRPRTRHFNILMEGYRRQLEEAKASPSISDTIHAYNASFGFDRAAVIDVDELCREGWKLYQLMRASPKTPPDEFTITSMMGLCRSSKELTDLLDQSPVQVGSNCTSSAVLRAAITAYGDLGDPSSAVALFAKFVDPPVSTRYWNVLLGALTNGKHLPYSTSSPHYLLDIADAEVNRILIQEDTQPQRKTIAQLDGLTCWEAVEILATEFIEQPNAQTYTLWAKAAQSKPTANATTAMAIFRNGRAAGIPADGRFANAVIRCFGDNLDAAIEAWKGEIRPACLAHENRPRARPVSPTRIHGKNLLAAYHALLFVSGRALRPNVALRLVYAMAKEGLEADETALNCYKAGKRMGLQQRQQQQADGPTGLKVGQRFQKLWNMADAYESLLYVECVKYDRRDKRRLGEKRIRIIL